MEQYKLPLTVCYSALNHSAGKPLLPVCNGDIIAQRYEVVEEIATTAFSTVVSANDIVSSEPVRSLLSAYRRSVEGDTYSCTVCVQVCLKILRHSPGTVTQQMRRCSVACRHIHASRADDSVMERLHEAKILWFVTQAAPPREPRYGTCLWSTCSSALLD